MCYIFGFTRKTQMTQTHSQWTATTKAKLIKQRNQTSNKKQIKQKQRNYRHTMVEAKGLPVNINQTLPAEILRQIFHLLSPADLKAVVLVCRLS